MIRGRIRFALLAIIPAVFFILAVTRQRAVWIILYCHPTLWVCFRTVRIVAFLVAFFGVAGVIWDAALIRSLVTAGRVIRVGLLSLLDRLTRRQHRLVLASGYAVTPAKPPSRGSWLMRIVRDWKRISTVVGGVIAVYSFWSGSIDQRKQKDFQAWQAITAAQGKPGNCGRIEALQTLYSDGVSLAGVDLSGPSVSAIESTAVGGGAYLNKLDLHHSQPSGVRLWLLKRVGREPSYFGADMWGATLPRADLRRAKLQMTILAWSHLSNADMKWADLTQAFVPGADLDHACLERAHLRNAVLERADLRYANLIAADLSETDLKKANVTGADFYGTDISGADMDSTIGFSHEQLFRCFTWAGANLPQDLKYLQLPKGATEEDMERIGKPKPRWWE